AFNAPDYDADPRVTDMNGNGVIDPEDLIMIFSDGVDDDHDGYVDNIAGWDFFEGDNDPFDEVDYGHGSGEARDSTAEANNGVDQVEPASWLYINGCTNFGGNLSVSVSSTSCSSEATGRSSGIAGLIVSAGRDAVGASTLTHPLTANEIRQIFTQTADDIDFE